VQAVAAVSAARRAALLAASQTVPTNIPIRALIDTGASCTCLDPQVIQSLGVPATGSVLVNTPSTGSTPHATDQYDVALLIPPGAQGQQGLIFPTIPVIASDLFAAQGIHALIGRDILKLCVLIYNGALGNTGYFTIGY
jgi:hypothetical protein